MNLITEHRCPKCGAFCTESPDDGWLMCPYCSRIRPEPKQPEPFHSDAWQFPDEYAPELAMALRFGSLTEHAHEF